MRLQLLNSIRNFSTTGRCLRSYLSENYKSKELWNERFSCKILTCNDETIKTINFKIMQDEILSNLELDIFINNSLPNSEEIAQLQESATQLKKFRRSLYAHTLLQSTPPALCRLFLYSERLELLARLLDRRVDYGIFPDFFSYNLIIEKAIDKENFALASKFASLVMLQEEFGFNQITDRLCLFALVKYAESRTDFGDWINCGSSLDEMFTSGQEKESADQKNEVAEKKEGDADGDGDDEDEEQEDVEYIRIPFLRNPYFDNHFDINNPRIICGKSLSMVSQSIQCEASLTHPVNVLGLLLQGKWDEAITFLKDSTITQSNPSSLQQVLLHYLNNLDTLEISEEQKSALTAQIEKLPSKEISLSKLIEDDLLIGKFDEFEANDTKALRQDFTTWAEERASTQKKIEDILHRKKVRAAIEAKREELKFKEQYLYFYDNLKKSRLTRINYD